MRQARSYRITGRVQGVGFRYFAWDAAQREGLTGWVLNMPDGSVEALAEGDRDALERFEASLGRGPAGARVHNVDRDVGPATGEYHEFFIKG
jgi:acylphosphatase